MASRRKPRPPNATAAEYILSPRLEKERTAVDALRKLGSDPPLNPLRRSALVSPRSPRTFREFISDDDDTAASNLSRSGFTVKSELRHLTSTPNTETRKPHGSALDNGAFSHMVPAVATKTPYASQGSELPQRANEQLTRDDRTQSSSTLINRHEAKTGTSTSSAYKKRPTNESAVKHKTAPPPRPPSPFPLDSKTPSVRRVLKPHVIHHAETSQTILHPSTTISRPDTISTHKSEEVVNLTGEFGDPMPETWQTETGFAIERTDELSRKKSYAQRASDVDLMFPPDFGKTSPTSELTESNHMRKPFDVDNYNVVICINNDIEIQPKKKWRVTCHPEMYIVHQPYIPEASLTRPHRQQTTQRQHLAVTEWAQQQTRLSVVHRRIFAEAHHQPGPPKPIRRVRVTSSRAKEAPPVISKISPKPAHLIGKCKPSVLKPLATIEPLLKRADTEILTSYTALNESTKLHHEERSEQTSIDNTPEPFRPRPSITEDSEVSLDLISADKTSEPCASESSTPMAAHQPRISFCAEMGEPAPPTNSQLKRLGSLVRKQSIKEKKLTSRERPANVPSAGGGLSAVFAAIKFGGARGGRRPAADDKAPEGAADVIYGPAPPANLTPIKLNWLPIRPTQIGKTIWSTLLQDDAKLPDLSGIHRCGGVINGKGLCGGVNQCYTGGMGELMSARAILTVGRNSQPDIVDSYLNINYTPIKLDPDYPTLIRLFFSALADGEVSRLQTAPKKRAGILDQRRIQNLQIALKGLGIYDDKLFIVQTVLDMNTVEVHQLIELYRSELTQQQEEPEGPEVDTDQSPRACRLPLARIPDIKTPRPGVNASFTTEVCGVLVKLVPTPDEIEMLRQADQHDLTLAEQHLLEWSSVNRFAEKLECLSSISIYVESYSRVYGLAEQMGKALSKILTELESGHVFKAILALTLKCGNYLNYKRRKFALGVQFSSLDLLRRTTSYQGNITLLRHISGVIDTSWPAIWQILEECFTTGVSIITLKELKGQLTLLEQRVRKICLEVTRHGEEHNELFVSVLSIFLDVSAKQITKLNQLLDQIQPMLLNLARLFIPDATDPEQGIDLLKFLFKFHRDLVIARDLQRDYLIQDKIKNLRKSRK